MELKKVQLRDIIGPEISMRSEIEQQGINDLATSIMEVGLINPLTLQAKGKKFEIIAGHRRFQALRQLQFSEVDANVIEVNENIMFQIRMDENLIREETTEIDEAIYIEAMQKKMNLNQTELAGRLGKSASYINERLQILAYEPNLMNALKNKEITFSVARELNRCKDRKAMQQFLRFAIIGGCTPKIARKMVKEWELELAERTDRPTGDIPDNTPTDIVTRAMMTECDACGLVLTSDSVRPVWLCGDCKLQFDNSNK